MALREHLQEMIALREAGKTYQEIGDLFGTSKQCVQVMISKACKGQDPARKCDFDIERIVYEGIYELFANDFKMTISRFTKIVYGTNHVSPAGKERTRRVIYNQGGRLSTQEIKNVCEYIGKPFEDVFKVRM